MALSRSDQLSRVWTYLDDDTRKAYEEGEIGDEDLLRVGLQQGWITADFSDVSGESSTVPVAPSIMETLAPLYNEPREAMANIHDALIGGGQRLVGSQLYSAADVGEVAGSQLPAEMLRGLAEAGSPGGLPAYLLETLTGNRASNEEVGQQMIEQGGLAVEEARQDSGNWLTRGAVNVASSPSSFVSIVGGPAAAIGGVDVFGQEYASGRIGGLNRQEAAARATGQASVETLLSIIPSGKLLGLGGDAAQRFLSDRARWASRTAATSVGEALQEGATTLAQLGLDKLTSATADSKELRDYANRQLPADVVQLWEQTRESMIAGALGGGGIGGGMAAIQAVSERGKLAGDVLNTIDSQIKEEKESVDAETRLGELLTELEYKASMPKITDDLSRMQGLGYDPLVPEGMESPAAPGQQYAEPAPQEVFLDLAKARVRMKDQNVPAPASTPTVPPPAQQETPAPVVKKTRKKKTVTEKAADIKDTKEFLDDIASGLRSNRTGKPTGVDLPKVRDAIINQLGSGDANAAARLLTNGNVKLVSSADTIPSQEMQPVGTAGFYDGNTTYVVADQLTPENIVGDFLTIAAHEIKHGGDLAADPTLRTTLGDVVGQEANARLNRQIEELARTGNTQAVEAVNAAKQTDQYELELPAYFIQLARDSRETGAKRVLNDAVSAVRTNVKKALPGDYKVNLNDVAYLSDQLIKETAIRNPSLAMDQSQPAANLQMIVRGEAGQADSYKSKDSNIKRWMSDADSVVSFTSDEIRDKLSDLIRGTDDFGHPVSSRVSTTLDQVLQHASLYTEYPELRDYKVTFVNELPGDAHGSFDPGTGEIKILADIAAQGLDYDGDLHRLILHEVQHAVQAIEGFDGGANPDEIRTKLMKPSQKAKMDSLRNTVGGIGIMALSQNNPVRFLSTAYKIPASEVQRVIDDIKNARGADPLTPDNVEDVGKWVLMQFEKIAESNPSERLVSDIKAMDQLEALEDETEALNAQAEVMYLNNQGESEARFTQFNIPVRSLQNTIVQQRRATGEGLTTRTAHGRAENGINPENLFGPDVWSDVDTSGTVITPTSPTNVGLASSALPLPRSEKIGDDPKALSQVSRALNRLLVPGGGYGPELNEILRHGSALPASLSVRATQYGNEFLAAIKQVAKDRNIPEDQLRKQLSERIESIDKLDTREARKTAVAALDREFPGVGKSLNALRDYKLKMTREIVALRLRDPKPLTKKEVGIYRKMKENAERYTTRAYLATYDNELGKAYGKHLMAQFEVDPQSEEGQIVQGALDYLRQNELMIPDREGLEALKIKDIRRIYEAWIGNSSRYTKRSGRKAMIDQLVNLPPRTTEQINSKSVEIVRDMLGLTKNSRARTIRVPGIRQNRTIISARKDMPEPLRKLLGEITDPYLRETISLQRMINLTTKTKVLTELFEKGKDSGWWSDERTGTHQRQLNNVAYGPMDGKWINQDVEDALTGTILGMDNIEASLAELVQSPDMLMQYVFGKTLPISHKVMALQKTWQVVASPFNMIANFVGALALMAPSQGIINPATYHRGMRDTVQVLGQEIKSGFAGNKDSKLNAVEELLFAGVTDSATMGEFKSEAFKGIHDQIQKMIEGDTYTPAKMIKTVMKEVFAQGEVANAMRQVYAFMDVWTKASTYYDRKNFWTEMNKLENMGMSDEDIMRKSGYEAAGTNISYERSVPAARILERNIPFFMFLTYFTETFRATAMSYAQVVKDFNTAAKATNPKAKALAMKMGTLRLVGTTAATVGIQQMVMAALGSEDEEEKKKRQLDPDYMGDKWIAPMGLNDERLEVMVEMQRLDPVGPMNEFFIALQEATPEERAQVAATAVKDMFVESKGFMSLWKMGQDVVASSLANTFDDPKFKEWDTNRKRETITERNYPEIYNWMRESLSAGDIGENLVTAIEALMVPAGITPFIDAERTQVSDVRPGDANIRGEPIHEELRALGYKAYVRDPETSMTFRTMDYDDEITRLRKERNDLNERAQYMDAADVVDALLDIRDQEHEAFMNLSEAMEGYLAFEGNTYKGAMDIVGNKKLASRLRSGRFESDLLDGKALERWYDQAKKEKGVDKQELREKYNLLREMYREAD